MPSDRHAGKRSLRRNLFVPILPKPKDPIRSGEVSGFGLEWACTNFAKNGAVLGRTTAEYERLLDRFDDLLVLVYLYESELAGNPDLGQLQALAAEVANEVSLATNAALFPDQRSRRYAVIQVMNGLQSACRLKVPPGGAPLTRHGTACRRG